MKTIPETDKNLRFIPLEKAMNPPPGLIEHIQDHYWCVHKTKGVVFWKGCVQGNLNKSVADRLCTMYPWAEVKLLSSVFRRIDPSDYCGGNH